MAEWSNAVDSKSIVLITGTGSSNLPLSAIKSKKHPCGASLVGIKNVMPNLFRHLSSETRFLQI